MTSRNLHPKVGTNFQQFKSKKKKSSKLCSSFFSEVGIGNLLGYVIELKTSPASHGRVGQ